MRHLFIGAHTDDVEIGCGGLILHLLEKGDQVKVIHFSGGILPNGRDNPVSSQECEASLRVLGISDHEIQNLQANYFEFNEVRLQIEKQPLRDFDRVYCTSPDCSHQDHQAVGRACNIAMRRRGDLFYYETMFHPAFTPNTYYALSEWELAVKKAALDKYDRQKARVYFRPESWEGMALFRGNQIGVRYAESFIAVRQLI